MPGKISITFDAYTSSAFDPYLAITAHYIDAPPDGPWRLTSDVLAFEHVPGAHNGANLASVITCVVDRFGFRSKARQWPLNDMASISSHLIYSTSLAGQRQTMHRPMTRRSSTSPKPSPHLAARSLTPSNYASGMCHALTWIHPWMLIGGSADAWRIA